MGRRRKRAELVVHEKGTSASGFIREVVVWRVPKNVRYPEGFKYRLALVDPARGKTLLLMDNHWPKGHHVHRAGKEGGYDFHSLRRLIEDFRVWSEQEEKIYES